MNTSSLDGLLEFLNFLNAKGCQFKLEQQRPDAIMISFALVTVRVEVEWFADHIEYSLFRGDERVEDNMTELLSLFDKHWD